jgi:hypothetical protein
MARDRPYVLHLPSGGNMNLRKFLVPLLLCFAGITVSFAADANLGTWKLNEAKSRLSPGTPKNHTVVYAAAGDSIKVTVDGTDSNGKPTHNEWTGKFDGKDYPVTGDPASDARSYTRVNAHTLRFAGKKGGKVIINGSITVSADGKTRTVAVSGTDPKGAKFNGTAVYDKQ